jgi:hypothetical protein
VTLTAVIVAGTAVTAIGVDPDFVESCALFAMMVA